VPFVDIDLGAAAAGGSGQAVAPGLVVDGGLIGRGDGAGGGAGRLGGELAISARADCVAGVLALLTGDLFILPIVGAAGGSSAAAALVLGTLRAIKARSDGASTAAAVRFSGLPGLFGVARGSTEVVYAHLGALVLVSGSAAGVGGAVARPCLPLGFAGAAAGSAVAAAVRLVAAVPLVAHSGSPGWERPLLAGAAAGRAAAAAAGLTVSGTPNVVLAG
jgi:hypothetical protein